jgi:hypothetical protein
MERNQGFCLSGQRLCTTSGRADRPWASALWEFIGSGLRGDRVLTFAYFIPTMIKLMRSEAFGQSEAAAKALQWVRLGFIRHAATRIAWLAA